MNDRLRKAEAAMEKAFLAYRSKHQDYKGNLNDLDDKRQSLADDLIDVKNAIQDLGIKPQQVKSYVDADNLDQGLKGTIKNLRNLYPSVT